MRIYIVVTAHWELRKGSSTPSSNCDVCARASTAFVLPVPVLFAFASRCFLRCSFASITIISRVCCDSNFLVCFLLRVEDRVEVGAVAGTWIEVLASRGWEDGITSSSLWASLSLSVSTWVISGSESSSLDEVIRSTIEGSGSRSGSGAGLRVIRPYCRRCSMTFTAYSYIDCRRRASSYS